MDTIKPESPLLTWVNQNIQGDFHNLRLLTDRVQTLPNLSDWTPASRDISVIQILSLGVMLGRITNNSFGLLLESIARSFKAGEGISNDDLAELGAAALIRPWCDDVAYIPRNGKQRTPDLEAKLGGNILEIEVTTAERKNEQLARSHAISELDEFLRLNLTRVLHRILTHPKFIS